MVDVNQHEDRSGMRQKSHIPEHSMFFEKIVPILLVVMGILMAALVLFAAGVLLGIVHF